MDTCTLCRHPVDGPGLTDAATGAAYHPACAVARLPHDALVALAGALFLALAPVVVLWAG